jgi:hypothetical protein
MHKQFALGLSAFQQDQWINAKLIFQALLENHRQVGPSQFYLGYMASCRGHPPAGWEGVAILEGK